MCAAIFFLNHFHTEEMACSYVSEEAACDQGRLPLRRLQLREEVVAVEVVEFLQVPKDHGPLPPEVLRQVRPVQQGEVVSQDVAQRSNILALGVEQLLQDSLQTPDQQTRDLRDKLWPSLFITGQNVILAYNPYIQCSFIFYFFYFFKKRPFK